MTRTITLSLQRDGEESRAQIKAFEDTWEWDYKARKTYEELITKQEIPEKVSKLIEGLYNILGSTDMMAYLAMMAIRLLEMRRILKDTGSIYLHCDPTASHYLKLVMDAAFDFNFRNEIIWHYRRWTGKAKKFQALHDTIFFYTKTNGYTFNPLFIDYTRGSEKRKKQGVLHRFKNGEKYLVSDGEVGDKGVRDNDVWHIPFVAPSAKERLGYPTQKPEKLLEKIVLASTNKNDIVLDPFCGCGTTITVAEKLNRNWIGIDITHLAVSLMKHRLEDTFGKELSEYEVHGEPKDLTGAKHLAEEDRFEFESWALSLSNVKARPIGGRGDKGIDGVIRFFDDQKRGKSKTVIIQVKSGTVNPSVIRDLKGTVEREQAEMGVLITLKEPTKGMTGEAAEAGFYKNRFGEYPKIQIVTIKELLEGKRLNIPPRHTTENVSLKKAKRQKKKKDHQESIKFNK